MEIFNQHHSSFKKLWIENLNIATREKLNAKIWFMSAIYESVTIICCLYFTISIKMLLFLATMPIMASETVKKPFDFLIRAGTIKFCQVPTVWFWIKFCATRREQPIALAWACIKLFLQLMGVFTLELEFRWAKFEISWDFLLSSFTWVTINVL